MVFNFFRLCSLQEYENLSFHGLHKFVQNLTIHYYMDGGKKI